MTTRTRSKPKAPVAAKAPSTPKSRTAAKTQPAPRSAKAPKTASTRKGPTVPKTVSAPTTVSVPKTAATSTTRRARKKSAAEPRFVPARARAHVLATAPHPQEVPNVEPESDVERVPDQPFEEGVHDTIDPDLRHRLISEAAYRQYAERGYQDGYDLDDWLQAEAEVDHVLLNPPPD